MRDYKATNKLPPMPKETNIIQKKDDIKHSTLDKLKEMTKGQLIDEVIKTQMDAERAKKGYVMT